MGVDRTSRAGAASGPAWLPARGARTPMALLAGQRALEGAVGGIIEQYEPDLVQVYPEFRLGLPDRADGHGSRQVEWISVDARGDGGEGHRAGPHLRRPA